MQPAEGHPPRGVRAARGDAARRFPRFPWTTIWYDEPGLSLAGIIGVCIGFCVVVSSICVLAQHAGFFDEKKKPKRPSEEEEASETDPLIPPEEKV